MLKSRFLAFLPTAVALGIVFCETTFAAQSGPALVTSEIDEASKVAVAHSIHPSARSEFDQGAAPDDLAMDRMLLVLKRSPERQAALDQFLEDLQQPSSANYHKWLTAQQFGERFGASNSDIQVIASWLQSHGFKVEPANLGRSVIEFSGNSGQVRSAFNTQIHKFSVNGVDHWANASEQMIPAALANAVAGVSTLHNMASVPQSTILKRDVALTAPLYTTGAGTHYLSPADYALIYNVNPLYPSVTGTGATIAVVGRTNINIQDVNSFRRLMGLPTNPPNIILNGTDPGDLGGGEEAEAVLDTSWAGALATGATVDLVVSASTDTTDGVDLSELYIINNNLANVMTESFGSCEYAFTAAQAALQSSNAQQAAAEGITYTVASGDSGSAGCDSFAFEAIATGPLSVNGLASTPYNVAVGGTQFNENGSTQYWNATTGNFYKSALSYIPEDVWNANCAGAVCGTGTIFAGGGGPSRLFAKPSWQTGVPGIPADGARDLPDISLTAAGHDAYLLCLAGSCSGTTPSMIAIFGTSASAPSFASIVALINQKTGSRLGQMTPRLYALAASQNLAACNASNTTGPPAASCIFNDVTVGTNAVPGEANYNTASETYPAGVAYDLASGLGSVNVTNLVNNWIATVGTPGAGLAPASLTFAAQTDGTTSTAQVVTLTNSGTAALGIAGVAMSGTSAGDFTATSSCGSSLAASSSCTISVTFTPSAAGSRSATLVVTDNSGNISGSTQSVALSGSGSTVATPGTFTTYFAPYGSGLPTYTGAAMILPLRAYNPTGASQISYLMTDFTDPSSGIIEYQILASSNGTGGYSLRLNNNSAVSPTISMSATGSTVTLPTPLTLGTASITAYRFALAGNEFQLDISITRSGTFSDQVAMLSGLINGSFSSPWNVSDGQWSSSTVSSPGITLSATSLAFGSQNLGSSTNQTLTLTNSGNAPLTITSVTMSGTNAGDFTAVNNCPASVAASGRCTIVVTFDPSAAGSRTATLSIADNVTGSPQTVVLSGNGSSVTSPTPTAFTTYFGPYGSGVQTFETASTLLPMRAYLPGGAGQLLFLFADFNEMSDNRIEYQIIALSNSTGGYDLRLQTSSSLSNSVSMVASGSTVTLPTPITLGNVAVTAYRFALVGNEFQLDATVTRSGAFSDQIALLAVQANNGAYSSPWNVTNAEWSSASSGGPGLTISGTNIAFGGQIVGVSSTQTLTLTNSGSAPLLISSTQIGGMNAGDFTATNNCPASVAAGGTCTVTVAFDPTTVGARTATLLLSDNAPGSPQTVALSGTGLAVLVPTNFTTYFGQYGTGFATFHGSSTLLPLRAYHPAGASQIDYLIADFNLDPNNIEYQVVALSDGTGGYSLRLQNSNSISASSTLTASGNTVTLPSPITLGTVSITAYRFALVGDEFQLDVSISRSETFTDQIAILAIQGNNAVYSYPWNVSNGVWSNP